MPIDLPLKRHLARYEGYRGIDGRPLYVTRCDTSRRIARYMGVKSSLPYFASAYCGPFREAKYAGYRIDGRPLYIYAAPCCGAVGGSGSFGSPSGSVSGSVSGSLSGSVSGSLSGSVSGSLSGSVSGSLSGSSGSGGGVLVPCCDVPVPLVLYATFGGSLAPLGTNRLEFNPAASTPTSNEWDLPPPDFRLNLPASCDSCDPNHFYGLRLICDSTNRKWAFSGGQDGTPQCFGFAFFQKDADGVTQKWTVSCDPFMIVIICTPSDGGCGGCDASGNSVVISETPP